MQVANLGENTALMKKGLRLMPLLKLIMLLGENAALTKEAGSSAKIASVKWLVLLVKE